MPSRFQLSRTTPSWILLFSLAAAIAVLPSTTRPADAIDYGDSSLPEVLPTWWAPHHIHVYASNPNGRGHIDYSMRWSSYELPSNLRSWENTTDAVRIFELGFKSIDSAAACDNATFFGTSGFPTGVDVTVDWTEDVEDAVLWVSDMDVVAADQRANPSKNYRAWWDCAGYFAERNNPYLSVSPNKQVGPEGPPYTDSLAHLTVVPAEQGDKSFPGSQLDPRTFESWIDSPWTHNPSFEDGELRWDNWWAGESGQNVTRFCDHPSGVIEGRCYLYLSPAVEPDSQTLLRQYTFVRTWSRWDPNDPWSNQYQVGTNTNFQLQGFVRCPTFNAGDCRVTVWLKVREDPWTSTRVQGIQWTVPRDGSWYWIVEDDYSPPLNLDSNVDVWIDSRGWKLDVDSVWVASGI